MEALEVVVLGRIDEDIGDLRSEVLRAKAALLYGDSVVLATHKLPLLIARMAVKSRLAPRAVEAAGGLDPVLGQAIADNLEHRWKQEPPTGDLAQRNMESILRVLRGPTPEAVLAVPDVMAEILRTDPTRERRSPSEWFRVIAPTAVDNYLRSTEVADAESVRRAILELIELNTRGLVDVHMPDVHDLDRVEIDDLDASFQRAVQEAIAVLTDAARREHPLFTRSTRLALRHVRDAGALEAADFTRANRVELAARLVSSVPAFPQASTDELVDLRQRVAPHLARFRAAIADFEDELNTDVLADDFDRAAADIAEREVAPALEALRESLHDTGALATTARAVPTLAASSLALGASLATSAFELAGVAAVAAGSSTAVARELIERRRQEGERKKHRLFLLFEAERQLNTR